MKVGVIYTYIKKLTASCSTTTPTGGGEDITNPPI